VPPHDGRSGATDRCGTVTADHHFTNPRQVIQRTVSIPSRPRRRSRHPAFGFADVAIRCESLKAPKLGPGNTAWCAGDATGRDVPWTKMDVRTENAGLVTTAACPPAGGIGSTALPPSQVVTHQGAVEPVGVGEVSWSLASLTRPTATTRNSA